MIAVTEKKIYYSSFVGHFKVGYDDLRNNLLNKEEASQQTRGCDEEIHENAGGNNAKRRRLDKRDHGVNSRIR